MGMIVYYNLDYNILKDQVGGGWAKAQNIIFIYSVTSTFISLLSGLITQLVVFELLQKAPATINQSTWSESQTSLIVFQL